MFVSETYSIEDCLGSHIDEMTLTSSETLWSNLNFPNDFEVSFDYNSNIGSSVLLGITGFSFGMISESGYKEFGYNSGSGWQNNKKVYIGAGYNTYKYIINGNTVQYYLNDALQTTVTYSQLSSRNANFNLGKWSGTSCSIKNIKIKPL